MVGSSPVQPDLSSLGLPGLFASFVPLPGLILHRWRERVNAMLGVALAVVRSKYWDEHDRRAHSLSFSEFVAAPVFLLAELVMAGDLRVGPYWLGSR